MSVQAIINHPATPWTRYLVGLSTFGTSLYLIIGEHSRTGELTTDKWHLVGHGALLAVGLLVLPGVAEPLFAGVKQALELYQQWKSGTPTPPK